MLQLEKEKKKKKKSISIAHFFSGLCRDFLNYFSHFLISWEGFFTTFRKKADEKQNGLPETLLVFRLLERLVPKVFSYLIICKCSALEQFALSPARETIDGMR